MAQEEVKEISGVVVKKAKKEEENTVIREINSSINNINIGLFR